ncbi:hypothetical protein V8Z77_21135 [Stutzerimonas stutzeri]|uniref:hypothetical protein n=1 Tax=Stutzerimonas stutzeri TaxID=316 RepID=UPI0031DB00BB
MSSSHKYPASIRNADEPLCSLTVDQDHDSSVADEVTIVAHRVVIDLQALARLDDGSRCDAVRESATRSFVIIDAVICTRKSVQAATNVCD